MQLVVIRVLGVIDQFFRACLLIFNQRPPSCFDLAVCLLHLQVSVVLRPSYGLYEELTPMNTVILILNVDHLGFRLCDTHERGTNH